jgi:hypothetical protein
MDNRSEDRAEALDRAVKRFGEAWASGDVSTLAALLSPTYSHYNVAGVRQDWRTWLDYVGKRAGRGTRIEFRDVEARILATLPSSRVSTISRAGARGRRPTSTISALPSPRCGYGVTGAGCERPFRPRPSRSPPLSRNRSPSGRASRRGWPARGRSLPAIGVT